jgi:hypothetical protein
MKPNNRRVKRVSSLRSRARGSGRRTFFVSSPRQLQTSFRWINRLPFLARARLVRFVMAHDAACRRSELAMSDHVPGYGPDRLRL